MEARFGTPRSERGFKLLTIVGCVGTLAFLAAEAYRDNVGGEYLGWQERYAARLEPQFRAAFEPGIKQAFLPELGRIDRCQSCHVGVDDPAQADAEQPLRTHPGLLDAHPPESFGCTICHQGQGRAVSLPAAHGRVAHWEEPLLEGQLVYTSCGRCHSENGLFDHQAELFRTAAAAGEIQRGELAAGLEGAALLGRGKQLVATSGCLGCHQYRGRGGALGPELTHAGDKGVHGYDFTHLPAGLERTPLEWLVAHFMDPGAVSPGTVMPEVGTNPEDARALAAYMLSLRTQDLPARYRPAPPSAEHAAERESLSGQQLYQLFCIACHGADLAGSSVPEIRTPSLSNPDFLSVADDEYLRYIVEHGRSGTQMPAWGRGSGGLTSPQIDRLVDYIRSFEPARAHADEVAALVGDPLEGRATFRGNCAACHGVGGEGGLGTRLQSPDFLGLASDEFLIHTIVEGRPGTGMPSWRNLSSQAVADVVAHLRTWQDTGTEAEAVLAYLEREAGDATVGEQYFRSRCATCHGPRGQGSIGPSLDHDAFQAIVSDEYLVHAILEGRPGTAMPAWRDLEAEDIGDLIRYLRTLSDAAPRIPEALVAQGDPGNGQLLFAQVCAACHGNDAVGGLGPQLRNPVFLAHASDGFLFETISDGRPGTPMLGFARGRDHRTGSIADLSEAQIADLVAWLRSLEGARPTAAWRHPALGSASRGRELYEGSASCAKCHGFEGQGGIGPALGNPWFLERASEGFLLGTMVRGRAHTEMRRFTRDGIAELSSEQLMDVSAYVRTLADELPAGRAGWRTFEATADRIGLGAELYGSYCAACHGPEGRGGYAPELNNPEFLFAASDGHLVATIARGRVGTPMRPFGPGPASMAVLDHEELRALIAYIRSWEDLEEPEN